VRYEAAFGIEMKCEEQDSEEKNSITVILGISAA
jgi:hypothetical protein